MTYKLELTDEQEQRASALHSSSTVVDCSIVVKYEDEFFERARTGGVSAVNHTVPRAGKSFHEGILQVNQCRRWITANHDQCVLVTSVGDIQAAKEAGKVGIILGPQDPSWMERSLDHLDIFYALGLRIMQLTYQRRGLLGDGCGERTDGGLSYFGIDTIRHMNELGLLIDLSHCGWKTTAEAIEVSQDPVVFTHSHPYSLTPHIRNKNDDLIRALAEKGGVIGISNYSPIAALAPGKRPSVLDVVTHIDHVVDLVGIDHVGLGLDVDEHLTPDSPARYEKPAFPELRRYTDGSGTFAYDEIWAEGLGSIARFPEITRALVSRGYPDDAIKKILGENFLRVFGQVWHVG